MLLANAHLARLLLCLKVPRAVQSNRPSANLEKAHLVFWTPGWAWPAQSSRTAWTLQAGSA